VLVRLQHPVPARLGIARIPHTVLVEVFLVRIGNIGTIVVVIRGTIAVVVIVHAIGLAVFVLVRETLVRYIITVVIYAVARLVLAVENRFVKRLAIGIVRVAIAIVVIVNAVCDAVQVAVVKALVHRTFAVVVLAIAFFELRALHGVAELRDTTDAVVHRVLTDSKATGGCPQTVISHPVAVVVQTVATLRFDTFHRVTIRSFSVDASRARVLALAKPAEHKPQPVVGHPVAVVVQTVAHFGLRPTEGVAHLPDSVRAVVQGVLTFALAAQSRAESVIHLAVAVVVRAIALLTRPGVHSRVQRSAVRFVRVPVIVIIRVHAVLKTVQVRVQEPFVRAEGAVVVQAVTDLLRTMVKIGVDRGAIRNIRVPVPIVILIALVPLSVPVEITLLRVLYTNTIIRAVVDLVAIGVIVTLISHAV